MEDTVSPLMAVVVALSTLIIIGKILYLGTLVIREQENNRTPGL
jgi:hypothetical protein